MQLWGLASLTPAWQASRLETLAGVDAAALWLNIFFLRETPAFHS